MTDTTGYPFSMKEGGEELWNGLRTNSHPYLTYLADLAEGVATRVEASGEVNDETYEAAFNEAAASMPQVSELTPIEIGVPETYGELKAWTVGCLAKTLAISWQQGRGFNEWLHRQDPGLPIYA